MRKPLPRVVAAIGVLTVVATPAWAHASGAPHIHSTEMAIIMAAAAGLACLWRLMRSRSRAD